MTEQANIDRANKAKAILEAPGFNEAFVAVRQAIIDRIELCSLKDVETAEHLRVCLKLLKDVRTNLTAAVESGKVDSFRMAQDLERKKNPLRGIFGTR